MRTVDSWGAAVRTRLLVLLVILPLATVSLASAEAPECYLIDVADTPEDPSDDLEACEVETWFHRADTPAGNIEALGAETYPTFDTEPPAGSVAGGNGGGYLGSSIVNLADAGSPTSGAHFVGEFDGVIDVMDITLHGFYNGFGSTGGPADRADHTIDLYVTIDDMDVINGAEVSVGTSEAETANAAHQFDFAVTGLVELMDLFQLDLEGTHTIEVTVVPKYVNTNPAALYVYDTTEVPGGIVFNPSEMDENATIVGS